MSNEPTNMLAILGRYPDCLSGSIAMAEGFDADPLFVGEMMKEKLQADQAIAAFAGVIAALRVVCKANDAAGDPQWPGSPVRAQALAALANCEVTK